MNEPFEPRLDLGIAFNNVSMFGNIPNGDPGFEEVMRRVRWSILPFTRETIPAGFWKRTDEV
jgi:hypothetical protein